MNQLTEYPVLIRPLPAVDGGGFIALVPDLPGCMSDGESPAEAFANAQNAITVWIEAASKLGRPIPSPTLSTRLDSLFRKAIY
ncbi:MULTISPECIES: type II toxin-antitoxin system HicB family antitoxin [Bradyrhizobium]|uniref:type II toxin-antitoxin system HicB family antitoxin n=1 Tax=Bradyrhizobium elkanii TaxID=29448 RepID=UPI0003F972F2|nr:type II toxin-antitoxin system HicB family antitoxin [Bradyrhizobium elkanii]